MAYDVCPIHFIVVPKLNEGSSVHFKYNTCLVPIQAVFQMRWGFIEGLMGSNPLDRWEYSLSLRCSAQKGKLNKSKVPIFTVNDIEVHVYSCDEHVAVDSDFIDGGGRQGMGHHHKTHDLAGDGPPMG